MVEQTIKKLIPYQSNIIILPNFGYFTNVVIKKRKKKVKTITDRFILN